MPAPWIGAHVTAEFGPWGRQNQYDQLNAMQASVCRIQMFWGGARRFSDSEIDGFVRATDRGPHIIMMSSEFPELDFEQHPDGRPPGWGGENGIVNQWAVFKHFARTYSHRTWTFEIGNEPDTYDYWRDRPEEARDRYLRAFHWCNGSKPGNVMIGISQPLDVWNNPDYWQRFNAPHPQYGSPIFTPHVCCVHLYDESPGGFGYGFCPHDPDDPLRPIRWIRSWESGKGKTIFVTEAGLGNAAAPGDPNQPSHWERANKYVDLANNLQRWSDEFGGTGWCDVVCFYYVGYSVHNGQFDARLRINEQLTPILARRWSEQGNC